MLIIDVLNPIHSRGKRIWMIVGPIAGIILEIGQRFDLIKGTYDVLDLFVFVTFPILYFKFSRNEKSI